MKPTPNHIKSHQINTTINIKSHQRNIDIKTAQTNSHQINSNQRKQSITPNETQIQNQFNSNQHQIK